MSEDNKANPRKWDPDAEPGGPERSEPWDPNEEPPADEAIYSWWLYKDGVLLGTVQCTIATRDRLQQSGFSVHRSALRFGDPHPG